MEYNPTDRQSAAYYTGELIPELGRAPVPTPYGGSAAFRGHASNYDPGAREHADREAAAVAEWLRKEQAIYTSVNTLNTLNNSTKEYKRIIEEERAKRTSRGADIERARQEARTESYHATDYFRRKANPDAVPPSPSWVESGVSYRWCPCCFGTGWGWADAGYDPRFPREMILRYKQIIQCECCNGHRKLYVRMGGGRRTKQKSRRKTHRKSKR